MSPNATQRVGEMRFFLVRFHTVRTITIAVQILSNNGNTKRTAPMSWANEKPTICGPRSHVHTVSSQIRRAKSIAVPTKKRALAIPDHSGSRATAAPDRAASFGVFIDSPLRGVNQSQSADCSRTQAVASSGSHRRGHARRPTLLQRRVQYGRQADAGFFNLPPDQR